MSDFCSKCVLEQELGWDPEIDILAIWHELKCDHVTYPFLCEGGCGLAAIRKGSGGELLVAYRVNEFKENESIEWYQLDPESTTLEVIKRIEPDEFERKA